MLQIHAADFVLNLRDTEKVLFVKRPSSSAILSKRLAKAEEKQKEEDSIPWPDRA